MWREVLRNRVEALREEFLSTAEELLTTQDHVQVLLSAVVSMAEDSGLDAVLDRIVCSACELVGARYGALGGMDGEESLSHFITTEFDPEQIGGIEDLPTAQGVFGDLIAVPAHHPSVKTFLSIPLRVRETVLGSLYLTEKVDGGEFSAEDEALCTALAAAAGVAIESARLFEATARRRQWLEAGVEANERILAGKDDSNEQILAVIAGHALAAADSALAIVALITPDRQRLICHTTAGAGTFTAGQEITLQPLLTKVLTTGVTSAVRTAAEVFGPGVTAQLGPALVVGLDLADLGPGLLILARPAGAVVYSQEDAETSILFSSRVALAVEMVHNRRERESLLVSEDRDRIARDLHDRVIQRIFAAGLSLQSLRQVITDEPSLRRVTSITRELDESIRELRETIYSLHHPQKLLEPLSRRVLSTISLLTLDASFKPRIELVGPLDGVISVAVAESLIAVVTEGLSNVVRHSDAVAVGVSVKVDHTMVTLEITDNGDGFANPDRMSGLANMKHRATALGGSCSIDSVLGQGTSLAWAVPRTQPTSRASS
ncbi:GAF domain-containing protein [Arthrobacter alpinus]|uniref:GAF domain-containing protein n=1 Tax=Arthrobacter alpinus TaxID=656366 RepID=A0A1H5I1J7_9MICC|nr:GAF domain-containing sensor histidine kinase [Arthrobacter alpinus]SEE34072.1 GAF domain-containing protein [Arthrobacter alpinus]